MKKRFKPGDRVKNISDDDAHIFDHQLLIGNTYTVVSSVISNNYEFIVLEELLSASPAHNRDGADYKLVNPDWDD